jgi:hypothetical protein
VNAPEPPQRRESDRVSEQRDRLFLIFVGAMFIVLILYGAGMTVIIVLGHEQIGSRMISGFIGMFTGILGLGSGYILGRHGGV